MNTIRSAVTMCALFAALASCGPAATPAPQTVQPQTESAPAKPEAAPALSTTQLTPATLVGRWGDNGDCTKDIVINADGTFRSYTGGGGTWTLNGDRMTMTGANGAFELRVEILNGNTLIITNPDGSVGTSQRC